MFTSQEYLDAVANLAVVLREEYRGAWLSYQKTYPDQAGETLGGFVARQVTRDRKQEYNDRDLLTDLSDALIAADDE